MQIDRPALERAALHVGKCDLVFGQDVLEQRIAAQPLGQPNAGSVFRNPPGDHAARLIEACGLKGLARGGARVSEKHANFIVNELIPLENLESRYTKGIIVRVDEEQHGERGLQGLYEILRGYPGACDVQLVLSLADRSRVVLSADGVKVAFGSELRDRIVSYLGEGSFRVQTAEFKSTQQAPKYGRGNDRRIDAESRDARLEGRVQVV